MKRARPLRRPGRRQDTSDDPVPPDVVMALVSDTWQEAVRRGFYSTADQTLLTLMRRPTVGRVLVADHPRGVKSQVYRRLRGEGPAPRTAWTAGVRPLTLVTPPPLSLSALERRYAWYDRQVALAARWHRLVAPRLVTFNLWHAALSPHCWADRVVFYAQDDESEIPDHAPWREQTLEAYRRIGRSGMTVVAVSEVLLGRIDPRGPGLVIPNGVDDRLWTDVQGGALPKLRARPVVVYAGTVDRRLDIRAFRAIAQAGFAVQIAGALVDLEVREELRQIDGVELLGNRGREEVVRLVQGADVCVLAHRRTGLTEAMSPLKLYEYVASGSPVVATRLPGMSIDTDRVVWVDPGGDYVGAVHAAMARGRAEDAERRRLVRSLSWEARHQPLVELLTREASS